jgi:hypothetical protein
VAASSIMDLIRCISCSLCNLASRSNDTIKINVRKRCNQPHRCGTFDASARDPGNARSRIFGTMQKKTLSANSMDLAKLLPVFS